MAYAREGGWSVTPGGEHRGGGSSGALGAWPTTNLIWIPEADNKHSARLRDKRNAGDRTDTLTKAPLIPVETPIKLGASSVIIPGSLRK